MAALYLDLTSEIDHQARMKWCIFLFYQHFIITSARGLLVFEVVGAKVPL